MELVSFSVTRTQFARLCSYLKVRSKAVSAASECTRHSLHLRYKEHNYVLQIGAVSDH
jgi:hypothetical protein